MNIRSDNTITGRFFNLDQVKFDSQNKDLQTRQDAALKNAAKDFEAIFLTYLLRTMRKSIIPESNLFGDGISGEIYTSLFDEKIAEAVASKGGLGLADIIIKNLQQPLNVANKNSEKSLSGYEIESRKNQSKNQSWNRRIISEAAAHHGVDPKLVEAVIKVESDYQPHAVSSKGAVGLMQLMESTAKAMGVKDRTNPRENVFGGVKYLKKLMNQFNGKLDLALGAYNAGPSAIAKYKGLPPYPETRLYVQKVLKIYQAL